MPGTAAVTREHEENQQEVQADDPRMAYCKDRGGWVPNGIREPGHEPTWRLPISGLFGFLSY